MRELFFIALILACPLLMMLMMRHGHGHGHAEPHRDKASVENLRRRRDELDRLIEEREESERPLTGAR
jgi:hypothetical protein